MELQKPCRECSNWKEGTCGLLEMPVDGDTQMKAEESCFNLDPDAGLDDE